MEKHTNTSNDAASVALPPEQIAACRKVHAAITARANANGKTPEEWVEHIGPDAFDRIEAEECATAGIDPNVFTAWHSDPDAQTEFEQNMGADMPTPTTLFEEQRIALEGAEAHGESAMTDSYDTSIADALGESTDNTSAQDCLDLVREAVENHRKLTAWAIAQRFRIRLTQTLRDLAMSERTMTVTGADMQVQRILRDIDALDASPGYVNACASHNYCDANMPMDEAFTDILGRSVNAADQADCDLFNAAWRIARTEGFANPSCFLEVC